MKSTIKIFKDCTNCTGMWWKYVFLTLRGRRDGCDVHDEYGSSRGSSRLERVFQNCTNVHLLANLPLSELYWPKQFRLNCTVMFYYNIHMGPMIWSSVWYWIPYWIPDFPEKIWHIYKISFYQNFMHILILFSFEVWFKSFYFKPFEI